MFVGRSILAITFLVKRSVGTHWSLCLGYLMLHESGVVFAFWIQFNCPLYIYVYIPFSAHSCACEESPSCAHIVAQAPVSPHIGITFANRANDAVAADNRSGWRSV